MSRASELASWIKIKTHQTVDCIIIGYTKGKGDRESHFWSTASRAL